MQETPKAITATPCPVKRARYEEQVYEVLYSTGGCVVLCSPNGTRVTVPRRKLVFIK